MNLSDRDLQALIEYARREFADERYPFDPGLKQVREAPAKLDQKPAREPASASRASRN